MEYITSHDTSIKNQGDQNYYSSHPDVGSSFSYHDPITLHTKRIESVKGSFDVMMPENAVGIITCLPGTK